MGIGKERKGGIKGDRYHIVKLIISITSTYLFLST